MLYKAITRKLIKAKIMKQIYTNDFLLNRVAGLAFDIMMIASIMAINVSVVVESGFLVTLLVLVIGGGFLTYAYVRKITKLVYQGYPDEAFLVFYGTMTMQASKKC
jgi:ESS family glutamate:Na+ symporter